MRHIYALWVLVALLGAASVFALVQVQNVQHNQNYALHSIICFSENYVQRSKRATPVQKRATLRFYTQALANAQLPPCS